MQSNWVKEDGFVLILLWTTITNNQVISLLKKRLEGT